MPRPARLLSFCAALLSLALPGLSGQVDARAAGPASAPLDEARAELAARRAASAAGGDGAGFAARLGSLADSLGPADGLVLIRENLTALNPADRGVLGLKAGGLALLLGRFSDAASAFEEASGLVSGGDASLLMKAARCRIASGELERAADLAAAILLKSASVPEARESSAEARLVGAWILAAQGRSAEALEMARALAGPDKGNPSLGARLRLEARFLVWLCSPQAGRAAAAAALGTEFPGSPEAALTAGSATLAPLPHWYLGSLAAPGAATSAAPGAAPSAATSSPGGTAGQAASPASPDRPSAGPRLQVGYFSKEENAKRLHAELAGKGFAASIVKTLRAGSAESRWIVVVEGGKEYGRTQDRLKDAGYESYPLE